MPPRSPIVRLEWSSWRLEVSLPATMSTLPCLASRSTSDSAEMPLPETVMSPVRACTCTLLPITTDAFWRLLLPAALSAL